MESFFSVVRWGCVLGMALFAPVTLPAGGGELHKPAVLKRERSSPLLVSDQCVLRSSPFVVAPALIKLKNGTPLRVLRSWESVDGDNWIQVQILSLDFSAVGMSARRGWMLL